MRPRLRRLMADFQKLQTLFASNPYIELVEHEGDPPEKYTFRFKLPGLELPANGKAPVVKEEHLVQILLPLEYPKRPPFCRMLSTVYHPNIDPAKICIGDHWSAGQSLAHLIARIGEMISFQSYNVKSPLNAEAAAWAAQNTEKLPLLHSDITIGL